MLLDVSNPRFVCSERIALFLGGKTQESPQDWGMRGLNSLEKWLPQSFVKKEFLPGGDPSLIF